MCALHRSVKAPVGLVIFFLRHRQACQKLRKNTTSPTGLLRCGMLYIVVQRRPRKLVIFSFAIDRLVKSCGKHHQLSQAYCVATQYIIVQRRHVHKFCELHCSVKLRLAVRREGAGMAFGSVRQACISSQKLSPPPPSVLCHELFPNPSEKNSKKL